MYTSGFISFFLDIVFFGEALPNRFNEFAKKVFIWPVNVLIFHVMM